MKLNMQPPNETEIKAQEASRKRLMIFLRTVVAGNMFFIALDIILLTVFRSPYAALTVIGIIGNLVSYFIQSNYACKDD